MRCECAKKKIKIKKLAKEKLTFHALIYKQEPQLPKRAVRGKGGCSGKL